MRIGLSETFYYKVSEVNRDYRPKLTLFQNFSLNLRSSMLKVIFLKSAINSHLIIIIFAFSQRIFEAGLNQFILSCGTNFGGISIIAPPDTNLFLDVYLWALAYNDTCLAFAPFRTQSNGQNFGSNY